MGMFAPCADTLPVPCPYPGCTVPAPCPLQAGVFAGSDFCLTLVLTAHFTSGPDPSAWPYLVLMWALAALYYEINQVRVRVRVRVKP